VIGVTDTSAVAEATLATNTPLFRAGELFVDPTPVRGSQDRAAEVKVKMRRDY